METARRVKKKFAARFGKFSGNPAVTVLTSLNCPLLRMIMTKSIRLLLLAGLVSFSSTSFALSESEAEDLADLTAVFVYLKNDCGYQDLPDAQIRKALVFFAQQNRWDLSNYSNYNMKALGEESYKDLSGIAVTNDKKCKSLARDSLSLLAYVK